MHKRENNMKTVRGDGHPARVDGHPLPKQGTPNIRDMWYQEMGFPGGSAVKNPPAVQETWVGSLGWEDPLEKEMATHSSTLAWEMPWTEESGGWQSMGLKKVGQDSATKQQQQEITEPYFLKSLVVKLINLLRLFRLIFHMVRTKKKKVFFLLP